MSQWGGFMKSVDIRKMTQLAIFIAIELLLYVTQIGYIPLPLVNATIMHLPVIVGAILLGPMSGAILGFVFGLTSMMRATFFPTLTSFAFSPFVSAGAQSGNWASLIIAFLPRILVGVVAAYAYKGLCKVFGKKNFAVSAAAGIAGVLGSMTNTLLVMGGIWLFFGHQYAEAMDVAFEVLYITIGTAVVINGVPEAIVAAILSAVIVRALLVVRQRRKRIS